MPTSTFPVTGCRTCQGSITCGRKKPKKNTSCHLNVAAWNIRTLLDPSTSNSCDRPPRRTALVASELSRYKIDIAALSETRLPDEDSLTEVGAGYTFFWRGLPKDDQRIHGVGFAIKTTLLLKLPESPVGISERIMTLRIPLVSNRHATIISAYAPHFDISSGDQRHLL